MKSVDIIGYKDDFNKMIARFNSDGKMFYVDYDYILINADASRLTLVGLHRLDRIVIESNGS